MRLTDLEPQFKDHEYKNTAHFSEALGIEFDCPGCVGTPHTHRIWAPFQGRSPYRYRPAWAASGTDYIDLTFSDSAVPDGSRSIRYLAGCHTHFNLTNGAIDFYGDSGHLNPRSTPMNETNGQTAAEVTPAKEEVAVATVSPLGYIKTHALQFINGILHQLHEAGAPGTTPAKVWVPVAGVEASVVEGAKAMSSEILAGLESVKGFVEQHLESLQPQIQAFEARLAAVEKALTTTGTPPAAG